VKQEIDAKPAQVKEVQEVTKERAKQEKQAPGPARETEQPQGGKKKKTLQTEEQITALDEAQQQQGEGQPTGKKIKKEEVQPQPGAEQLAKKKKATGQAVEAQPQQSEEQPIQKKKKATKQSTQP